jgi:hypothetical protein
LRGAEHVWNKLKNMEHNIVGNHKDINI